MSYRNELHGVDSDGEQLTPDGWIDQVLPDARNNVSADGATLPRVTADQNKPPMPDGFLTMPDGFLYHATGPETGERTDLPADTAAEGAPAEVTTVSLDMAYLYQRRMREMQILGLALPEGITPESLDEWEREHPDFDRFAPFGGQPMPEGIRDPYAENLRKAMNGGVQTSPPLPAALCTDEWQPPHTAGSHPADCATCWQAPQPRPAAAEASADELLKVAHRRLTAAVDGIIRDLAAEYGIVI